MIYNLCIYKDFLLPTKETKEHGSRLPHWADYFPFASLDPCFALLCFPDFVCDGNVWMTPKYCIIWGLLPLPSFQVCQREALAWNQRSGETRAEEFWSLLASALLPPRFIPASEPHLLAAGLFQTQLLLSSGTVTSPLAPWGWGWGWVSLPLLPVPVSPNVSVGPNVSVRYPAENAISCWEPGWYIQSSVS